VAMQSTSDTTAPALKSRRFTLAWYRCLRVSRHGFCRGYAPAKAEEEPHSGQVLVSGGAAEVTARMFRPCRVHTLHVNEG
jgi:hypothetical protein